MFEKMERSEGNVIGVRISGQVTQEDYKRLVPDLEHLIEEHGAVNMLLRFDGFSGMEAGALWEDLKFDVRHLQDIARLALVKEAD